MERLRQRADFLAAGAGLRIPSAAFVLQARRRDDGEPARFGFTVSRKVGTAVERNRARRRLKDVVRRAAADGVSPGHDYVLVARREALTRPFNRLIADFGGALHRLASGRGQPARPPASRPGGRQPSKNTNTAATDASGDK